MNKFLTIVLLISISCIKSHAFDLDMTVDDEIRKNYNSSKLINDVGITEEEEETLPSLPAIIQKESNQPKYEKYTPAPQVIQAGNIKIHKGTSFNVVNSTKISDWQTKGASVKFTTKTAMNTKKYSIPAGTTFSGEVIESHQPQITCNGGLVVIRVRSMLYKGQTYPINAYVTKANSKKVFLNNIKGNRTYLKTVWKKGNWGRVMFNKMMTLTVNLGGDGSTLILSPFPLAYGTLCFGLNTLTSPICAFFSKGGHVNIPAGSQFRIKLIDDAYVN